MQEGVGCGGGRGPPPGVGSSKQLCRGLAKMADLILHRLQMSCLTIHSDRQSLHCQLTARYTKKQLESNLLQVTCLVWARWFSCCHG